MLSLTLLLTLFAKYLALVFFLFGGFHVNRVLIWIFLLDGCYCHGIFVEKVQYSLALHSLLEITSTNQVYEFTTGMLFKTELYSEWHWKTTYGCHCRYDRVKKTLP